MNMSSKPIQLDGCQFGAHQAINSGDHAFTARKQSKGGTCTLNVAQGNNQLTNVVLTPKQNGITYNKQTNTLCLTEHKILKSWKKCPWGCGRYEVHGYLGICTVWG